MLENSRRRNNLSTEDKKKEKKEPEAHIKRLSKILKTPEKKRDEKV